MLDIQFWQSRYDSGQTPWDLGQASPHFINLLQDRPAWLVPGKMAVLGSGRGHDAALFAKAGFEVVGFDYAPGAVQAAQAQYGQAQPGNAVKFQQMDIFELANPQSPWAGQFDYVLEHTCFCAILPKQRPAYLDSVKNILKPGGILIGVFWELNDPDGPPFTTTETQLHESFDSDFELLSMQTYPAAMNREGFERLVILRRSTEV